MTEAAEVIDDATLQLSGDELAVEESTGEPEAQPDAEVETEAAAEVEAEPSESSTENKGVQKRIDKLTYEAREAQRQAEYWREKALQEEKTPEPAKTLEDFEYDEAKYNAYQAQQITSQAVEAAKRELAKERAEAQARERDFTVEQREKKFSEENGDYFELTRSSDVHFSAEMRDITADMEDGPAVRYHLAKNPDIASQIFYMPPLAAARELGRIEVKLQTERSKAGKKVSDAPEPAPTIKPGTPAASRTLDEADQEEFNRKRREYINKHRRR